MNAPAKTSMQWKQLAATHQLDADGLMHASIHLADIHTGYDFVVTVTGYPAVNAGYWAGAVAAAAEMFRNAAGMDPLPGTTLVPRTKSH